LKCTASSNTQLYKGREAVLQKTKLTLIYGIVGYEKPTGRTLANILRES
jgi:hypothetical protein